MTVMFHTFLIAAACRQRIIFETPEFDIQYDDKYSGGYR